MLARWCLDLAREAGYRWAMDLDRYIDGYMSIERRRQRARDERIAVLRARLSDAAAALAGLGATRVLLFGSLAHGEPHASSDVDLAVVGIPVTAYWRAIDGACRALGTDHVDLVRLEEAAPTLRARILEEGVELWRAT